MNNNYELIGIDPGRGRAFIAAVAMTPEIWNIQIERTKRWVAIALSLRYGILRSDIEPIIDHWLDAHPQETYLSLKQYILENRIFYSHLHGRLTLVDAHTLQTPDEPDPYAIGDTSCRFNANSPLIRCAVNPDGPCEVCRYYEVK